MMPSIQVQNMLPAYTLPTSRKYVSSTAERDFNLKKMEEAILEKIIDANTSIVKFNGKTLVLKRSGKLGVFEGQEVDISPHKELSGIYMVYQTINKGRDDSKRMYYGVAREVNNGS